MRPYWKGYLKLALVSCPIAERLAFRQIDKATGNRLRQQLIDEDTPYYVAPKTAGRWTGDITARIVHAVEALSPAVERAG